MATSKREDERFLGSRCRRPDSGFEPSPSAREVSSSPERESHAQRDASAVSMWRPMNLERRRTRRERGYDLAPKQALGSFAEPSQSGAPFFTHSRSHDLPAKETEPNNVDRCLGGLARMLLMGEREVLDRRCVGCDGDAFERA